MIVANQLSKRYPGGYEALKEVSFQINAGDMVFLNNHFHVHARTNFTDSDDPKEKRHLRRLWLEADEWAAHRPKVMSNILVNAQNFWRKPESTVTMWD